MRKLLRLKENWTKYDPLNTDCIYQRFVCLHTKKTKSRKGSARTEIEIISKSEMMSPTWNKQLVKTTQKQMQMLIKQNTTSLFSIQKEQLNNKLIATRSFQRFRRWQCSRKREYEIRIAKCGADWGGKVFEKIVETITRMIKLYFSIKE